MSSLILSHDSHLIMLEIAVENLFVPWTTEIDKVILKKTVVMFRMLDKDWISLSPNRRDYRPYRGANYENEKFYGGKSVVFSVPTDFFRKEMKGVGVQLYVRKKVCKYFETVSRQRIGFAVVPVDNLLNNIAKQIRERDELVEYLSDFCKRQIISRSMMGTYSLLDESLRDTAATITLYIRISYLGKCLITEITQVKSIPRAFYTRGELDEKQPYFTQQLTPKELQSRSWIDSDLPRVPSGRLICRCEELIKKKAKDLTKAAVDKRGKAPDSKVAISVPDADVDKIEEELADVVADATMISVPEIDADVDEIEKELAEAVAEAIMISNPKVADEEVAVAIQKRITQIKKRVAPADAVADAAAIKKRLRPADAVANAAAIEIEEAPADAVADAAAIKKRLRPADAVADAAAIEIEEAPDDVESAAIERRKLLADTTVDTTVDAAAIEIEEAPDDVESAAIERRKLLADTTVDTTVDAAAIEIEEAPDNVESAAIERRKLLADMTVDTTVDAAAIEIEEAPDDVESAAIERRKLLADTTVDATVDAAAIEIEEALDDVDSAAIPEDKYVEADAAVAAKEYAIKDNGKRAFKKAFPRRYTATIGIVEREKRILPLPSSACSRLQTYPLCRQLQPHLTCFTDCFDISPCYCYWTACPLQFFCTMHKQVYY